MKTVYVTQPSLPPLGEFIPLLEDIWERKWLTNGGYYHQELETSLAEYLGVKYVSLFCNGTVALQTGLKALDIKGEVITTPFTFVATAHSIKWNDCTPVFCDIEPDTFNLDPSKVEALITDKTTAIMPVHVYGNPCDTDKLRQIANKHNLKLFYDAAHAFGVEENGESILNAEDLSMVSFHATKVFNTIEGGALITNSAEMKEKIDYLKNFGFEHEESVVGVGINGKMNELQAAYGLLQLKYIDGDIGKCRELSEFYRDALDSIPGIKYLNDLPKVKHNYSYFPILVDVELFGSSRDELYEKLKENGIMTRKYFYPLVSSFSDYKNLPSSSKVALPVANEISSKVLCLPMYSDLRYEDVLRVVEIIRGDR
ncbi:DegT/DnrJ/EryC1/StrS family aminotransferase [Vibrio genomosp. F10 str. 9ZC157]|uniref:Aminotransferase n=1 Tax=Vibrio genomosp. F10 str. ZF-129 TaxID=1187848 RepID=A0A1E5BEB7_9VIBR|nr:DegT/DnrJ/EryC1/StrS family aminotransferase [Vibrio genomosp. F10]OEE33119.1 aminotransferase [Vibrio genomosp. F10 str. ZF-129]OEE95620.1 aminotransferase [Vibrio genomosp. F10 str. 9ZC157]